MDSLFEFLALIVVLLTVVVPAILLICFKTLKKETRSLEAGNNSLRDELRGIVWRVYALEKALQSIGHEPRIAQPVVTEIPSNKSVAKPEPVPINQPKREEHPAAPSTLAAPLSTAPQITRTPPREAAAQERRPTLSAPNIAAPVPRVERTIEARRWADLEERVGANWLNKIGTAAFVIGVALLLNYSMHYLGAAGKIGLGYALSAIFLAAGILGERRERYRIAARAVLGGGWALAYFTTYALHNIAAVRLVASPLAGFALLFGVAVAMVTHSLRYQSEVTTGFAYLLAFVSVGVSNIPIGALIGSALLAISLVVILRARGWYALEPLAIAATYVVHWLWLNQMYERIGGRKPFPELIASVALLSSYWLIYLVSYFLRRETGTKEARLLTASFLLNAVGYLSVLDYQAFHPEWRFLFLLAAGAVYVGVSVFSLRIGRRLGFILASTLGTTLIVAAGPYRYSGSGLEIFWLIAAESLLIVGWRATDAHLRKLGWMAAGVLSMYVCFHDLWPRFTVWRPPNAQMGWMLLALAAAFLLNGGLKYRLGAKADQFDEIANQYSSAVGTGFLLAAAWVSLPFVWTGLVWTLAGVALAQTARRPADRVLRMCGHGSALLAVTRLLVVNMRSTMLWNNVSLRLITVAASAALLYLFSGRTATSKQPNDAPALDVSNPQLLSRIGGLPAAYTSAATLLIGLVIWNEVTTAAVGLGWGLFGLTLLKSGQSLRDRPLTFQGRLLLVASFARIFFADLNSTARIGQIPAPVWTITVLAIVYYFAASSIEDSPRISRALNWFGTVSVAALLRFELPLEWVAVGWAVMTVILYGLGRRLKLSTFRNQSYVMVLLVGIRCAFNNFYQVEAWHFTDIRTATVIASTIPLYVLFAATQLAKQHHPAEVCPENSGTEKWKRVRMIWALIETHPQRIYFFVPTILLTALLSLEVRRSFLTAAWGLEGLAVFLAVLKMDERPYRWFSLSLLLLCVGRLVTVDIWTFDALGRIVSFMVLGAALLAVSFLYARHREIFRRVL